MIRHFMLLLLVTGLAGCHTVAPLPPADLGDASWHVRQGQAVWQPNRQAPEIVGELMVATRADGEAFVQFTKNPFPFAIARLTTNSWQAEFPSAGRFYSGRGRPPTRLIWLQLARWLQQQPLPASVQATNLDEHRWRLQNRSNGETLEGYLDP